MPKKFLYVSDAHSLSQPTLLKANQILFGAINAHKSFQQQLFDESFMGNPWSSQEFNFLKQEIVGLKQQIRAMKRFEASIPMINQNYQRSEFDSEKEMFQSQNQAFYGQQDQRLPIQQSVKIDSNQTHFTNVQNYPVPTNYQEFSGQPTYSNQSIHHKATNFANQPGTSQSNPTNIHGFVSPPHQYPTNAQTLNHPKKPLHNTSPQVQPSPGNECPVYQNDPNVLKQLEYLRKVLKECKDPKKMAEITKRLKILFWEDLKKQTFKVQPGSVVLIGRTSSGKSSLLNTLFGLKLKTSKGQCTREIECIFQQNDITVHDCPGFDQYFDLVKNPQKIPVYLGGVQTVYYLYDGYIEDDILKTLSAMKKKFYAVRTKCDPDDNPSQNQTVRSNDIKTLKSYGYNIEVFLTSKVGGVDNQRLRKHILSKKQ